MSVIGSVTSVANLGVSTSSALWPLVRTPRIPAHQLEMKHRLEMKRYGFDCRSKAALLAADGLPASRRPCSLGLLWVEEVSDLLHGWESEGEGGTEGKNKRERERAREREREREAEAGTEGGRQGGRRGRRFRDFIFSFLQARMTCIPRLLLVMGHSSLASGSLLLFSYERGSDSG